MPNPIHAGPCWSTASFGDATDTSATELSALKEHLQLCQGLSGRMFAMRCQGDAVHGFITAHFVTTLLAAVLLLGLGSALLF
jgi:hypothetical protein